MSQHLPESDWKRLRKLHAVALDRFCERTLKEVVAVASTDVPTAHDRYVAVYRLLQTRDKELAWAFDDLKRSQAIRQLAAMVALGLVTEAELEQFSPDTQSVVRQLTRGANERGGSA